jgi:uncharacterized surface protein with fasciclin (FAS1) repeats
LRIAFDAIVDVACDNDDFSILCEALQATGLDRVLTQEGPFTVFAPVDDAFLELGQSTIDALLQENRLVTLTDILLYHVVLEEGIFLDDLKMNCLRTLEMANGDLTRTLCHTRSDRTFQIGRGNSFRSYPEIVIPDVEACNGVAHALDRVILPALKNSSKPGGERSSKSAKSGKSAKSSKSSSRSSSKEKKVKRTKTEKWSK